MSKVCPECGEEFSRPANQRGATWSKRVYCSRDCYAASMRGTRRSAVAVECPECGETFYAKPSYIRNGAGKHCSRECAGKARSRTLSGEGHWNWSTGRVVTRQGYIRVWVPSDHRFASMRPKNQGGVLEHRLVMAETLGRPLTNRETVHHINGDRSDNRLENLQLRRSQHGQGQRYVCADCGSENIHEVPV